MSTMRIRLILLTLAAVIPVLMMPAHAGAGIINSDSATTDPRINTADALIQLTGDSLSTSINTKPARGKKIDFNSATVKSYQAQLSALRNDFKSWLHANAPKAKVTGEYDLSLNAVAVQLNGTSLATIAGAPQVQYAEYQGLYTLAVDDPDLALISATQAWEQSGGPANAEGRC